MTVSKNLFALLLLFTASKAGASTAEGVDSNPTEVTVTDGLTFKNEFENFSLRLGFRAQIRGSYDDNDPDAANADVADFQVRRLRVRLDGRAGHPNLYYTLQFSFSRGDMDWDNVPYPNILRDANVSWRWAQGQTLIFGLRKLPGNRQRVVSSGQLEFVDRAISNATFNIDRDTGIHSWHRFGDQQPWWIRWAVTNGEGRGQRNRNNGLSYTARIESLPLGDFKDGGDYFEGDLSYEETLKASFGLVWNRNDKTGREGGQIGEIFSNSQTRTLDTFMADALFKFRGWSWASEFFWRSAKDPILSADQYVYVGRGFNSQVSYVFPSQWSPAVRWTLVQPDTNFAADLPRREQLTLGLGRYLQRHKIKVQGDLSAEDERHLSSPNLKHYSARIQLEYGI
jgi:phosphate-selective porin OprO and OprP